MKKKFMAVLLMGVLTSALVTGCGSGTQNPQEGASSEEAVQNTPEEGAKGAEAQEASSEETSKESEKEDAEDTNPTSLDDALTIAIFEYNEKLFAGGELSTEGHIMMDKDEDAETGNQICYCLATFGKYEFQNGNFVRCAGNGVIPTVITLSPTDGGEYSTVSYVEAEDGNDFVDSIKENFPEKLWSRCITIEDEDAAELDRQEMSYVDEYLGSIGREDAPVGDYADFDYKIPTDLGISEEVSNKLVDVESSESFESNFTIGFGDREVIEDGVRYVYKKEYDSDKKVVTYEKINYETKEVIESSAYDSTTGEKIKK